MTKLSKMTPLQAYREGLMTWTEYQNKTAGPNLDDYCFCGRSNLWDDRCKSCGKRPYTD